ncbi:MAG: peptidase [Desulfarculales bacterium]|jgi:repressor LexA|nr:peptidase [Desulfarculales bacterium]
MSVMNLQALGGREINLDEAEVPLLGLVAAGRPIEAVEDNASISIPRSMLGRYRTFALEVRGTSMINEYIKPGDIIIVEERSSAENGEVVVALINETDVTLKKYFLEKEFIRLEPANPEMEPIILPHGQVRVLGAVSGLIRHYAPKRRLRP